MATSNTRRDPVALRSLEKMVGLLALVLASAGTVGIFLSLMLYPLLAWLPEASKISGLIGIIWSGLLSGSCYLFVWGPLMALPLGILTRRTRAGRLGAILAALLLPASIFMAAKMPPSSRWFL